MNRSIMRWSISSNAKKRGSDVTKLPRSPSTGYHVSVRFQGKQTLNFAIPWTSLSMTFQGYRKRPLLAKYHRCIMIFFSRQWTDCNVWRINGNIYRGLFNMCSITNLFQRAILKIHSKTPIIWWCIYIGALWQQTII